MNSVMTDRDVDNVGGKLDSLNIDDRDGVVEDQPVTTPKPPLDPISPPADPFKATGNDDLMRSRRIAELEEKALAARSKRQFEKLEEKVAKRQALEAQLLEAERQFREEKVARKEAEENFDEVMKRLNDATNSRLKAEEQASTLLRTEDEIKKMEAIVSKLKERVPVLTTELEKTLAVAHEQSLELSSFDAESSQQSRVIEQERLEAQNAMDEELRALGLHVARLTEHVMNSDHISERDSEVLKGLLHDENKMLSSAQADCEMRKGEIKQIDARLNRIMKTLELTQEAHQHLRTNMENTTTLLEEAKENDQREYKYMHRRLTMPFMREELHYDENADRSDPLPHTKPNRAKPIERFANRKPLAKELTPEEIEVAEEAKRAETDAAINSSLDFAFNVIAKPTDPFDQPPLEPVPAGSFAEALKPEQTEGEQLVSQSIQLLKEMQEKQAKTNQSFNKTADHYQMSLERLDKEIQLHQKHLDEAEQQDYSEWNKHVAPSPDKKGAEEPSFRAGAVKSHIKGKSLLELFHYYDQDDSGTVNKGELICILSDLGVLDGLSPDDASKALDDAYRKADDNGDGGINYKEFSMFMNSFSHVKPKPSLPQNIPDSFKENGKDEIVWQVYLQHCSKKFPQEMGSAQFIRAMRKAGFVDEKVNPSATAILFAKARKPMAKRMQYPEFLRALAHMATVRGLDFEEAAGAFANKAILRPITNVGAPRDVIKTDDYEGNADEAEDEVGEVAHDEAAEEADAEEGKTFRIQEAEAARQIREASEAEVADEKKMSQAAEKTRQALLKKAAKPVDMNSWDTKDAIDAVGQSAVPKSMVEASGKRMSIRDLYNKYDADNSGELDQAELASLITDLEMLKDLEPAEVPVIIEEYFKKADTNNDGKVCFDEFALFYMHLRDVKKAGTSHLAVKVPKKWRKDEDLTTLFVQHCTFGKGNKTLEEMDGAAFAKMCAAAGLLDEKLTNTTVDLIFTKSKEKGKRKLHYNEFLEALALVASHKGYEFDELVLIIVEAGAPKLAAKPVGGSTGTRKTSIPGMPSRSGPTKPSQPKKVGKVVKAPGAGLKPVPMQSAAGKNMTVREMFDEYDPDRSGILDRIEFGKLVEELQLTKGLSPTDASKAIDAHYLKCDVKGEGNIDFREFTNWYKELNGEKVAAGATWLPKVSAEYKKNADFKALFVKHCSFGKGNKVVDVLDGAAFVKCLKHAKLIGPKCSTTSADIIFTKSKEKGQRTIKWTAFLNALAQVAGVLGKTFEEVADSIIEAGPPKTG